MLEVVQLEVGLLQNFCEVIGCPRTGEAALVDPAFEVDRLLRVAERRGWRVTTILLTHSHDDHVAGLDEAAAAAFRKENLAALENDLRSLPVAGGTAYDWAVAFVHAGEKLSGLLGEQADAESHARKNAQLLRSETIGLLNDLRRAIAREKKRNSFLPDNIDELIFGYFDTLEDNRERTAKPASDPSAA